MRRMAYGLLVLSVVLAATGNLLAQSTPSFQYVFPLFNSQAASEFVLSNLSSRAVTAEITLTDSNTGTIVSSFQAIPANGQQRFTAASFAVSSFNGSLLVTANGPLSAVATIGDGSGNFETVPPAVPSDNLIVPFGPAINGSMNLTIFNPASSATPILISVMGTDGSDLANAQTTLPGFGTLTTNVNSLVSQPSFSQPAEISHVVVRALSNVLQLAHVIYVQGSLVGFSDETQGIVGPHFDFALINAVPAVSAATNALFPLIVQGGDYSTVVQVVNPAAAPITASLTLTDSHGQPLTASSSTALQVPANGSVRVALANVFNFPDGINMGSLTVTSSNPFIATVAITSVAQNGFAVLPPSDPATTNFTFRTRAANPQYFVGLSFLNSNSGPVNLTVLNIPDNGSGVSSAVVTIPPFSMVTRTVGDLLPEATTAGFVYVSSDTPITAAALEGRIDDSMLANLPAMHSQASYVAPSANKFLITGNVTNNGVALAGASIQLSGPVTTSTVTDAAGNYQFANTPPGPYTVQAVASGFTISPPSIRVTVTSSSQRGNNFVATLVTPVITAVQPPSVTVGSSATTIVVAGGPFMASSKIIFDGAPVATTLTSAGVAVTVTTATGGLTTVIQNQTVLQATIPASSFVAPRVTTVNIQNVGPNSVATSAPTNFSIGSPAPVITQLLGLPTPLLVGNSGFTLTVIGTDFISGSAILVQNTPLTTSFISSTQLAAFVPSSLLGSGGTLSVSVIKPQPTIGPSNALTVTLTSPVPGMTSISPSTIPAEFVESSTPLPLIVNGFGFVTNSVVSIDGVAVPTTYNNSTQIVASIPQEQLVAARIALITVTNPPPTIAVSHFDNGLPLGIYNPIPTVTGVDVSGLLFDPVPRFTGDKPTFNAIVILHGTNFAPSFLSLTAQSGGVRSPCAGSNFSGQRVSSTEIIGQMSIDCTGTYSIGLDNPQPGGADSNMISFTVALFTAPTPVSMVGMAPAGVLARSGPFNLTITGSNFSSGAVVNFGTAVLTPSSISPTVIVVTVPAYLVQSSGIVPVSVTNPDFTGNSNGLLFTVN